jgi:hypothetical protein
MDDQHVAQVADHFRSRLKVDDSDSGTRAQRTFIRALRALPDPDHLVVGEGSDGPDLGIARALALVSDRLLEIRAFRDDDNEYRTAYRSRSLADRRVCVEMEWGPLDRFPWGAGHETRWVFKFPDGPDVEVVGTVGAGMEDVPGPADAFAREVAGRVGLPAA